VEISGSATETDKVVLRILHCLSDLLGLQLHDTIFPL